MSSNNLGVHHNNHFRWAIGGITVCLLGLSWVLESSASPDLNTLPGSSTPSPELPTRSASPTPSPLSSRKSAKSLTPTTKRPGDTTVPTETAVPVTTDWKSLPIVPATTHRALEIYQKGISLGNDPNAFSKVGDCESSSTWFLVDFDTDPPNYILGDYAYLADVIRQYHGSFGRTSLSTHKGATASMVLDPLWNDPKQCGSNETPLACEYRLHKPTLALIMLGTNDSTDSIASFEAYMRQILDYSIDHGVIPVLATKADNLEGNDSFNFTISKLAAEYAVPLWNFYAAVQPLPGHGLQDTDETHLTWQPNQFDNPNNLKAAWPMRNLTALQTLDSLRRGLQGLPPSGPISTSLP